VQRRIKNTGSPHDYTAHVEGNIVEDHIPGLTAPVVKLDPDQLLGPYEQQAELLARREAEMAEVQRANEAADAAAKDLAVRLYQCCGLPVPENLDKYDFAHKQPFRVHFQSVEITKGEGIQRLMDYLTRST